jgi:hypothetical protein
MELVFLNHFTSDLQVFGCQNE